MTRPRGRVEADAVALRAGAGITTRGAGYPDPDNPWHWHPEMFPAGYPMPAPDDGTWRPELARYRDFHAAATACHDNDPVYPVLKAILEQHCPDRESMLWGAVVFVAYYDLGSALRVLEAHPYPTVPGEELLRLPTATERRAHRDVRQLVAHLTSVVETANTHGGLVRWLQDAIDPESEGLFAVYPSVFGRVTRIHGNGRWAAYKMCDLLAELMWPQTAPTDMGHENSTGPLHGLRLLHLDAPRGNGKGDVPRLNHISDVLCQYLWSQGLHGEPRVAETTLCDYHALAEGRYYVGHDIDQMQGQLTRTPSGLTELAFAARAATLPQAYLGEHHGWEGIRRELRTVFRDTGQLVVP